MIMNFERHKCNYKGELWVFLPVSKLSVNGQYFKTVGELRTSNYPLTCQTITHTWLELINGVCAYVLATNIAGHPRLPMDIPVSAPEWLKLLAIWHFNYKNFRVVINCGGYVVIVADLCPLVNAVMVATYMSTILLDLSKTLTKRP